MGQKRTSQLDRAAINSLNSSRPQNEIARRDRVMIERELEFPSQAVFLIGHTIFLKPVLVVQA
jgi:hypothetical protein